MSDIKDWDKNAANNNSVSPDGFPEGMNPSGLNNSAREVMAAIRRQHEDAQWIDLGDTPAYISASSFSLTGDQTGTYEVGRRVKITDSSTIYGTIATSVYTSVTTIAVTLDSGSITASISAVAVGMLSTTNVSMPKTDATFGDVTVDSLTTSGTVDGVDIAARDADLTTAQTDITNIEAKTDHLTVTQAVNLDTTESLAASAVQNGDSPSFGNVTVTGTVDGIDIANDVVRKTPTTHSSFGDGNLVWFYTDANNVDHIYYDDAVNFYYFNADTTISSTSGNANIECNNLISNGNITVSGTVDGVDIAARDSALTTAQTDITNIESKTDFISITQSVDLDVTESLAASAIQPNDSPTFNNLSSSTLTVFGSITVSGTVDGVDVAARSSDLTTVEANVGTTNVKLNTKVIDIGDWNMDTTISVSVAHGLTLSKIRSISAVIRSDDNLYYRSFDFFSEGDATTSAHGIYADATNVVLSRSTGGRYDGTSYDSTAYNRGWITIQYTD